MTNMYHKREKQLYQQRVWEQAFTSGVGQSEHTGKEGGISYSRPSEYGATGLLWAGTYNIPYPLLGPSSVEVRHVPLMMPSLFLFWTIVFVFILFSILSDSSLKSREWVKLYFIRNALYRGLPEVVQENLVIHFNQSSSTMSSLVSCCKRPHQMMSYA